jgi:hypothetical protein
MLPPVPSVAQEPRGSFKSVNKRKRILSQEGDEGYEVIAPQAKISKIWTKNLSESPHLLHLMKAKFAESGRDEEWRREDTLPLPYLEMNETQVNIICVSEKQNQKNGSQVEQNQINGNPLNRSHLNGNVLSGSYINSGTIMKPNQMYCVCTCLNKHLLCIKSDQMDIILLAPDPHSGHGDPDPFLFQLNVKPNYTFSRKF